MNEGCPVHLPVHANPPEGGRQQDSEQHGEREADGVVLRVPARSMSWSSFSCALSPAGNTVYANVGLKRCSLYERLLMA